MKKKICIVSILVICILSINYFYQMHTNNIEYVLKTDSYNYLSNAAKDYIRDVYEETGVILLTEKNKVVNKEYLNPSYVYYLDNMDDSNSYVPEATVVDFSYVGLSSGVDLPKKFDLRNVDGHNYTTYMKKQEGELCWDFGFTTSIESKLIIDGVASRDSIDFSEKRIDYLSATPLEAIDIGINPYFTYNSLASLFDGGNLGRYMSVVTKGVALSNEEDFKYSIDSKRKAKPYDIWNADTSLYGVDGFYNFSLPTDDDESRNEFIKVIKENIMQNGAIAVDVRVTSFITYKDEFGLNNGSSAITYFDETNPYIMDHLMVAIGWDDDFSKYVCISENGTLKDSVYDSSNNKYSCNNGNLKLLEGAWILQNSYGENHRLSYMYLPYASNKSTFTSITKVSERDWDNSYGKPVSGGKINNNNYSFYYKKENSTEKLKKINVYSHQNDMGINIYVRNGYSPYELVKSDRILYAGLYSYDLSDMNITLDQKYFDIKIEYDTDYSDIYGYTDDLISVFTDNVTDDIEISIKDVTYDNSLLKSQLYGIINDGNKGIIVIDGVSRNVTSDMQIDYAIYDSIGNNVSDKFNFYRNYSVSNYINSIFTFDDVDFGTYNVKVYINNVMYDEFIINIDTDSIIINGIGTIDDPYRITNATELNMMREDKYSYYILENDIDLTYDTQNENGLFYNNSLGWEPIKSITGGFDGNGHKIIGLYINRPTEDNVGFISRTRNENYSDLFIRNITFENVNITGRNNVGTLLGNADGYGSSRKLFIENISVMSGIINGNNNVGGIAGYLSFGDKSTFRRHYFNGVFNAANVNGNNNVGGIVGYLTDLNSVESTSIYLDNMLNVGNVNSSGVSSGLVGDGSVKKNTIVYIYNSYNIGFITGTASSNEIIKSLCTKNTSNSYENLVLSNIYYYKGNLYDPSYNNATLNNVELIDFDDFKDSSLFTDFTTWNSKTIDGVKRIYIPSFVDYNYVSLSSKDINIYTNKYSYNIYDYINIDNNHKDKIAFTIDNNDIVEIDNNGNIIPKNIGSTNINIFSYYDGYANKISLNVSASENKIIFIDGTNIVEYELEANTYTIPNNIFSKDGYTFVRWNTKSDGTGTSYNNGQNIEITENITLYAQWEINKYTIEFNANGGGTVLPSIIKKSYGSVLGTLPTVSRDGYTFDGWYDAVSGGNKITSETTMPSNDVTYYAHWTVNEYTVTFNSNDDRGLTLTQKFEHNKQSKLNKNTFERNGYKFVSWNTVPDGTGTSYTNEQNVTLSSNLILYAIWQESPDYVISKYTVDKNNKYIDLIDVNTTVDSFKENIQLNTGFTVDVDYKTIDGKNILYTGGKTRIYKNGVLNAEYTNIIRGDVNGNAIIDIVDYIRIMKDIMNISKLSGVYMKAADVNQNNKIDIVDYIRIMKMIMEEK